MNPPLQSFFLAAAKDPEEHGQRIVELIHDAFLQGDDGVVSDANLLGANLRAALRNIAITQAKLIFQETGAVESVERMHFEAGDSDEKPRARELFLLVVLAKNMTHILAKKTFDALAKLLHAIHVDLGDFPCNARTRFERRDFAVDTIVPRNVGDKVFDFRKRFHRQDSNWLVLGKIVHTRLAGQARAAVDFRGTRAALPCLAIPTDGEIGSEVSLNVMERVKDNHARGNGDTIFDSLPAIRIAAKNAQDGFLHDGPTFLDLSIASSHRRGKADPMTRHLVNFVGPMYGVIAFIACP